MQAFSSKINIKKITLIPLLLSIPFIYFLLLALYGEHSVSIHTFLERTLPSLPESLINFIEFPILILLLCSVFLLCCASSFFCGKIISEKNKYIYLIKFFMCIFWIVGIIFLFCILGAYSLITDGAFFLGIIFINTTIWLIFKAVVDIIQFVYDIIKNRKHKSAK